MNLAIILVMNSEKDSTSIYHYSSLYHSGTFYIFGGKYNSNNIARLDEVGCPLNLLNLTKSHLEILLIILVGHPTSSSRAILFELYLPPKM